MINQVLFPSPGLRDLLRTLCPSTQHGNSPRPKCSAPSPTSNQHRGMHRLACICGLASPLLPSENLGHEFQLTLLAFSAHSASVVPYRVQGLHSFQNFEFLTNTSRPPLHPRPLGSIEPSPPRTKPSSSSRTTIFPPHHESNKNA